MKHAIALAAATLLPAAHALGCEPALRGDGVLRLEGDRYVVAWRAPAPLPLAEFFSLDLAVCARGGQPVSALSVSARMPEHGHGMNYRPSIAALSDGRFRADGLLLHMPGRWVLAFSVGEAGTRETLRDTLTVE
jgi:hypothetical protein